MQEDAARIVRTFMNKRGLNQVQLAKLAGVSQSIVSRALRHAAKRGGRARNKLCIYIQEELGAELESGVGKDRVLTAFDQIWDKTEAHATAVAKVIKALNGLRPPNAEKDRNSG